jgi:hypothetical protein
LLERSGAELNRRLGAYGAADWLPPAWVSAIEEHRDRRVREADEARRRVDPEAATERVRPSGGRHVTRRLEPAVALALRRRQARLRKRAAIAALPVLLLAGAVPALYLQLHKDGQSGMGLADQPLRLLPVQQSTPGACPDAGDPNTLTSGAGNDANCITVASQGGMRVQRLASVRVRFDAESGNNWIVEIDFLQDDAERWAALTERVASQEPPRNQIAIVFGDRFISAPAVRGPITDGRTQIIQDFTQEQAQDLARGLGAR